jgi:hypothetical protein
MWVEPASAGQFIARTTNATGRRRDQAVLAAAVKALAARRP